MKRIAVTDYAKLKPGNVYTFESMGFQKTNDGNMIISLGCETGTLKRVGTKQKEIKHEDKPTGTFETVADICVYDGDWHLQVTIGCGLFRIYEGTWL